MTIARRATVVTVAACVPLALGVGTAQAAARASVDRNEGIHVTLAVSIFPDNIVVFPDRDFVTLE